MGTVLGIVGALGVVRALGVVSVIGVVTVVGRGIVMVIVNIVIKFVLIMISNWLGRVLGLFGWWD